MYYTYVLLSRHDKKLYIGFTSDLKQRLKSHSDGHNIASKNRRPLELIYYEAYVEKNDAERREKYLKSGFGRDTLKEQLKTILNKLQYKYL